MSGLTASGTPLRRFDTDGPDLARAARLWQRRRRRERASRFGLGIGIPVLVILAWELGSRIGLIDPQFFPAPSNVARQAWSAMVSGDLLHELLTATEVTLIRLVVGFLIGTAAGLVVGLAMGTTRYVRFSLAPIVQATYPMPKIAILPLLLVLLGIGEASKIALIALGVFFMVALNTLSGVVYSNPLHHDVAKSFSFPRVLYYRQVVIPSAMPSILSGVKLGMGQALILVVSVEFVSSDDGLGHFIWNTWQILDISRMFVGLAVILLLGALAALLGGALERWLVPWAEK